jgi:hypothetical protein
VAEIQDCRVADANEQNRVAEIGQQIRLATINGERVVEAPKNNRIAVVED